MRNKKDWQFHLYEANNYTMFKNHNNSDMPDTLEPAPHLLPYQYHCCDKNEPLPSYIWSVVVLCWSLSELMEEAQQQMGIYKVYKSLNKLVHHCW